MLDTQKAKPDSAMKRVLPLIVMLLMGYGLGIFTMTMLSFKPDKQPTPVEEATNPPTEEPEQQSWREEERKYQERLAAEEQAEEAKTPAFIKELRQLSEEAQRKADEDLAKRRAEARKVAEQAQADGEKEAATADLDKLRQQLRDAAKQNRDGFSDPAHTLTIAWADWLKQDVYTDDDDLLNEPPQLLRLRAYATKIGERLSLTTSEVETDCGDMPTSVEPADSDSQTDKTPAARASCMAKVVMGWQ